MESVLHFYVISNHYYFCNMQYERPCIGNTIFYYNYVYYYILIHGLLHIILYLILHISLSNEFKDIVGIMEESQFYVPHLWVVMFLV